MLNNNKVLSLPSLDINELGIVLLVSDPEGPVDQVASDAGTE